MIPPGGGDEIPIQLKPGTSGVIYKGKLLLMVRSLGAFRSVPSFVNGAFKWHCTVSEGPFLDGLYTSSAEHDAQALRHVCGGQFDVG